VSEPIPYDRMRRILGLPVRTSHPSTRWAVRKIRTGDRSGLWGVWRYNGSTNYTLAEALPTWPEAIDRVRDLVDARRTASPAERTTGEHRRARNEVLTQA